MDPNYSEMAVFARAVDTGSFSAAARTLNLTPSAVSKQVGRLEDRLGARLLNRTTRRLSLTEAGEDYYQRATRILADIAEAERAVAFSHESPRGSLRVSASIAFGQTQLVPLISEFLALYPEIQVELNLSDSLIDVVEEGVDVAIRVAALPDSSHIARRIASERRIVCAAPSYLARHGTPRSPEDLSDHNCLIYSTISSEDWQFRGPDGPRSVKVASNFVANGGEAVRDLAIAGLGIVRLATFLVGPAVRDGRLVPVLTDFEERQETAIHAVYPHRRNLTPKVRAFVDYLADKLSPPPWSF